MATVNDGQNPGRTGTPSRQPQGASRQGRAGGEDPTTQPGQYGTDVFGFPLPQTTNAPGSQGAAPGNSDVTVQAGQLEGHTPGIQVTPSEVTSTGLEGTQGHAPGGGGGTSVQYTDPFGYMGNDHRISTASADVDGPGDWTAMGDASGFEGATFPVLEGCRPVKTGAGQGNVTGASHPNAMDGGPQPRNGNSGRAAGPRHPDAGN